jgi:hypothetical protein
VPAEVIATVMVLQALEGLVGPGGDQRVAARHRLEVACGLRLDDEGFHPTVQVVEQTGVLTGRAGGCWTPPSWRMPWRPRTP